MSVFERSRQCTKKIPCRLKLSLMLFSMLIIASVLTVPYIATN